MSDGIVNLDTEFAQTIGFTSDKFDGYLWRDGDRVVISFIVSKQPGNGHFSALMNSIKAQGLRTAVPTPFPQMESILTAKGFVPHEVYDEEMGMVEVWEEAQNAEELIAAHKRGLAADVNLVIQRLAELFGEGESGATDTEVG